MFLFSAKHKTPISTYTDSYRPPYSVKHAVSDRRLLETWKENKFVTQGLTMPPGPSSTIQAPPDLRAAMREYYKSSMYPTAYSPGNFTSKGTDKKYKPVFVNEDKYVSWRTSPSTTAWTMEPSYLPLLPKETGMNTWLYSIPVMCPLRPTCLNQYEKAVVADMMHRVPVYTVAGRIPFQSYYYPCSGRHCCLRGIDCYLDGIPITRKKLFALEGNVVRWDTGFFTNTAGVQRSSYTIHPDFVSEGLYLPAY
ncbi:sperm microtubule inner protein 6 [Melopsittacus undulatus]|uniref:sperm microtubule inner protein 6 n=1 Tax=Melopsittacus undulatus TaxID=13146 RepID=UPI0003834606|nr:spermatid-specific manchette-related protein 1 [Melopsittacus undulatus]